MKLPFIKNCVVQYLSRCYSCIKQAYTDCKTKSIIYRHRDNKPTYWKTVIQWHFLLISQDMAKDHYASAQSDQSFPVHLCCFLAILFMFIAFSCYINYNPVLDSMFDQLKMIIMVCLLLFLLAVHWLSSDLGKEFPSLIPLPEKDSLHKAWRTPWGKHIISPIFLLFHDIQPFLLPWTQVSFYEQLIKLMVSLYCVICFCCT